MKYTHHQIYLTAGLLLLALPHGVSAQSGIKFSLPNFLNFNSIEGLVVGILNILIVIAVPIIVLYIIYAGFLYVTAQGNAQQIQQATRALTYSVIGGVLVIGAVAISAVVSGVVSSFISP
jgi:hypothetical protein